ILPGGAPRTPLALPNRVPVLRTFFTPLTLARGDRRMMACYCRVSSHRPKVDSQKADILRWLTGHTVAPTAIQCFEDVESGTTLKRPAFDRMQHGIFAGTI